MSASAAPVASRKGQLLALARELGNVSEACRRLSLDRSEYYRLRRKQEGEAAHPRSPLSKSLDLESKLIALCLEYPEWGCDRLAYYLTLKGDPLSSPTAQKILIRHGLGRMDARAALTEVLTSEGVRAGFPVP